MFRSFIIRKRLSVLHKKSWIWPIFILFCIYKKTKIYYLTIPPASVLLPTTTWSARKSRWSILFCEFKIGFCGNGSNTLSFRPHLMLKIPNRFLSFFGFDTSWGQLTFLVNHHLFFKVFCFLTTSFDTVAVMEVSHRVFKVCNEGHATSNSFLRVNTFFVSVVFHSNSLQSSRVYLIFDKIFVYNRSRELFLILPDHPRLQKNSQIRSRVTTTNWKMCELKVTSLTHDFITNVLSPEVKQLYIFYDSWKRRMKMASLSSWFSFLSSVWNSRYPQEVTLMWKVTGT